MKNISDSIQNLISEEVKKYYWVDDINCARTTLKVLATLNDLELQKQTINSAIGLHGAGGYRAQCGIVEGSLMFISIYAKEIKQMNDQQTSSICKDFAAKFDREFGSLSCMILRPNGFNKDDPPHLCEEITKKGIIFTYDFCTKYIN